MLETFGGQPHLCLFATQNIAMEADIRYDYGVSNLPWRKKANGEEKQPQPNTSCLTTGRTLPAIAAKENVHDLRKKSAKKYQKLKPIKKTTKLKTQNLVLGNTEDLPTAELDHQKQQANGEEKQPQPNTSCLTTGRTLPVIAAKEKVHDLRKKSAKKYQKLKPIKKTTKLKTQNLVLGNTEDLPTAELDHQKQQANGEEKQPQPNTSCLTTGRTLPVIAAKEKVHDLRKKSAKKYQKLKPIKKTTKLKTQNLVLGNTEDLPTAELDHQKQQANGEEKQPQPNTSCLTTGRTLPVIAAKEKVHDLRKKSAKKYQKLKPIKKTTKLKTQNLVLGNTEDLPTAELDHQKQQANGEEKQPQPNTSCLTTGRTLPVIAAKEKVHDLRKKSAKKYQKLKPIKKTTKLKMQNLVDLPTAELDHQKQQANGEEKQPQPNTSCLTTGRTLPVIAAKEKVHDLRKKSAKKYQKLKPIKKTTKLKTQNLVLGNTEDLPTAELDHQKQQANGEEKQPQPNTSCLTTGRTLPVIAAKEKVHDLRKKSAKKYQKLKPIKKTTKLKTQNLVLGNTEDVPTAELDHQKQQANGEEKQPQPNTSCLTTGRTLPVIAAKEKVHDLRKKSAKKYQKLKPIKKTTKLKMQNLVDLPTAELDHQKQQANGEEKQPQPNTSCLTTGRTLPVIAAKEKVHDLRKKSAKKYQKLKPIKKTTKLKMQNLVDLPTAELDHQKQQANGEEKQPQPKASCLMTRQILSGNAAKQKEFSEKSPKKHQKIIDIKMQNQVSNNNPSNTVHADHSQPELQDQEEQQSTKEDMKAQNQVNFNNSKGVNDTADISCYVRLEKLTLDYVRKLGYETILIEDKIEPSNKHQDSKKTQPEKELSNLTDGQILETLQDESQQEHQCVQMMNEEQNSAGFNIITPEFGSTMQCLTTCEKDQSPSDTTNTAVLGNCYISTAESVKTLTTQKKPGVGVYPDHQTIVGEDYAEHTKAQPEKDLSNLMDGQMLETLQDEIHQEHQPVQMINESQDPAIMHTPVFGSTTQNLASCKKGASQSDGKLVTTGKGNRAKPFRPCLFCGKMQSKLTRHLKKKHFTEERVQSAMQLPKEMQNRALDQIRKDGIMSANKNTLRTNGTKTPEKKMENQMIRERRQGKVQHPLAVCSICNGFYSANTIYRHKRCCTGAEATTKAPIAIPATLIVSNDSVEFRDEVLSKFRRDDVGELCRTDDFIKLLGMQNFIKIRSRTEKKGELKDSVMAEMRRFAHLFLEFKSVAKQKKCTITSTIDILNRDHFTYLQEAVINVTTKEDGSMKSGLKVGIGFLLKKAAKVLKGQHLLQKADDKANDVDNFLTVLSYFWNSMFSDAQYANVKARQTDLRKPKHLPDEADLQKLRSYIFGELKRILDPFVLITDQEFKSLRDILVCRLTLFNARRGGEPSRLLIKEWKDAENGVWMGNSAVQAIDDPIEKRMLGQFKIAYQSGKNINQMVPLLIPNDCLEGLRKLACDEIRTTAGVKSDNIFLFPITKGSVHHIKGWHAVDAVCQKANISSHINATSMRHRASTIYAALDVPEDDRRLFYQHMGHSEDINKNVYQCPLAVQEVTRVGQFFENLDKEILGSGKNITTTQKKPEETCKDTTEAGPSTVIPIPPSKRKAGNHLSVTASPKSSLSSKRRKLNPTRQQEHRGLVTASPKSSLSSKRRKLNPTRQHEHRGLDNNDNCNNRPYWEISDYDDSDRDEDYKPTESGADSEDDDNSECDVDYISADCNSQKKGQRIQWPDKHTNIIKQHFKSYVYDATTSGRTGSLPGKLQVQSFIKDHPSILAGFNPKRKVLLIRTKIYNERNKTRSIVHTQLQPMWK